MAPESREEFRKGVAVLLAFFTAGLLFGILLFWLTLEGIL